MRFVLIAPIPLSEHDYIPADAMGDITRYDAEHQLLTFDVNYSWGNTLVLDEYDTAPEVWGAIQPIASPSMTDPPWIRQAGIGALSILLMTPVSRIAYLLTTDHVGFAIVYLLTILWVGHSRGMVASLSAAFSSMVLFNFFVDETLFTFDWPTVRETSAWAVWLSAAVLVPLLVKHKNNNVCNMERKNVRTSDQWGISP